MSKNILLRSLRMPCCLGSFSPLLSILLGMLPSLLLPYYLLLLRTPLSCHLLQEAFPVWLSEDRLGHLPQNPVILYTHHALTRLDHGLFMVFPTNINPEGQTLCITQLYIFCTWLDAWHVVGTSEMFVRWMTELKDEQTSRWPCFSGLCGLQCSGAGLGFGSSSHGWAATTEVDTLIYLPWSSSS